MNARAANVYRRVDLESAPKTQILDRLFERFASDLVTARRAIETRDVHTKAAAIDHALRIVVELKASLDHAAAPELCANLEALYDFVTDRLTDATILLSVEALDHATRIMNELAEAFRGAPPR